MESVPPEPSDAEYDVLAPDGSQITFLTSMERASMVLCTVPPGMTTQAVTHRSVEEVWYIVSGDGQIWRKNAEGETITELHPGVGLNILLGVHFQFRCTGTPPLRIVITTIPPWPGEDEAIAVENHWLPTVQRP